ncbi:MAG: hypothetical protein C0392_04950 [Syntrophus sp. (in: bacteria)]|nr:hypothetical protein [Syntrophus sp. (in: bacteria)]
MTALNERITEEAIGTEVTPRLHALVDSDGVGRVYQVSLDQIEAAFQAVGGKTIGTPGRQRIVFYAQGKEPDYEDTINQTAYKIKHLGEVMETLGLLMIADKGKGIQDLVLDSMSHLSDIINDEARELDTLLSAIRHSQHEAEQEGRPIIEL